MLKINEKDMETICAMCNLKSYRQVCIDEYMRVLKETSDEDRALSHAVRTANELNG